MSLILRNTQTRARYESEKLRKGIMRDKRKAKDKEAVMDLLMVRDELGVRLGSHKKRGVL